MNPETRYAKSGDTHIAYQVFGNGPQDLILVPVAVHTAARVAALAQPDEVLVSSTVKDLVAGSRLAFEARGTYTLKGVPCQWPLFAQTPAKSA